MLNNNTLGVRQYAPQDLSQVHGVITVKEAMKLLGQKSENLTNEELKALIQATETVVRVSIRTYISSKNVNNNVNIISTGTTKL